MPAASCPSLERHVEACLLDHGGARWPRPHPGCRPTPRAEPGNLSYEVCADPADPAVFALFEKYVDAGAFTAHTETPHFQKYLRAEVLPNLSHRTRHDLTDLTDPE